MSREKHRYILTDVRRLTAQRGLTVTWPQDRNPHWEVSHLAYLLAAGEGRGPALVARVYRARWQEGRDISDRVVVAGLAADVGVEADTSGAAEDPDVRRRPPTRSWRCARTTCSASRSSWTGASGSGASTACRCSWNPWPAGHR
jgi:2-hydroxychromene-2-carboxylate isomerase